MAAGSNRRPRVVIDGRTENLSDQYLDCRGRHAWVKIPPTQSYRKKLLAQQGLIEIVKRCECGVIWTQRYDTDSWDRIYNNLDYKGAEGYLAPKGTGRIAKIEVLKAQIVRENPELFLVVVD